MSFMHELQSTYDLCCVKLSKAGWQRLYHFQQPSETSLLDVLEQKVQIVFVLESSIELHDVWVPRECLRVFTLSEHRLNFVIFNNVVLFQDFQSILLKAFFVLNEIDLTVSTLAKDRKEFKIS